MLEAYLKFGVRFPLHTFFVEVLKHFKLTVFQVTPNGWAHMIGLFGFFVGWKMGLPTIVEFIWFYSIKANKNDEGFYYFAKRPTKGLQTVTKINESLGNWKEPYFYTPETKVKGTFGRHVSNLLGLLPLLN